VSAPQTTTSPTADSGAGARLSPVAARVRQHLRNPLNTNVYALTLNTVVSSLFGIGYWVLAARLYSPRDVGIGAAMVSTMTFLSNLSQLNLNGALARFLPAAGPRRGRLIAYAYGGSCLVALAVSGVFLLIAPVISERLGFLARTPGLALLFAVSVATWGIFTLQDSVLTALRGAVWVPIENAAFGIGKAVMLVLLAGALPSLGIFVSWNVAAVAALLPVNVLVFRRLMPRLLAAQPTAALPDRPAFARFVALDYIGYLFMQASTNALPLIVTARLGAEANSVFYVAWLLGGSLELIAYHFGTSLTVESSADERRLPTYTRQVLRRAFLVFGPTVILLCVLAQPLLTLFGGQYAEAGSTMLRLFAVSVLPKLIVVLYVAACRVQRKVGKIILIQASISTLVVTLAAITMGSLGVTGIGIAYLAGHLIVAAAILPSLLRLLRAAE
jgi:O-antigen/teichoic acid export membrane protein